MRKIIFGSLIAFIVVAGALLIERSIRLSQPIKIEVVDGKTLNPNLKLKTFPEGKEIEGLKLPGKVMLINFWATWCDSCIAEIPSMVKLYSLLKSEGFEIVAINVDEDPAKVVPEMAKKLGINFPIYTDIEDGFSKQFNVVAIPFSVLIDSKKRVVWSESGERNWMAEDVVAEIRKLLKDNP